MQRVRGEDSTLEAAVGYAAAPNGFGVVYARLRRGERARLLRFSFRARRVGRFWGLACGYAALTAVAEALGKRGIREVRFLLGDSEFVQELRTGKVAADVLAMQYVRMRCALNPLESFSFQTSDVEDLTQRARAEAALNVAA